MSLSKTDVYIIHEILSDPQIVLNMDNRHLADFLGVSPGTLTKCCQHMGFKGYSEFKYLYTDRIDEVSGHLRQLQRVSDPEVSIAVVLEKLEGIESELTNIKHQLTCQHK